MTAAAMLRLERLAARLNDSADKWYEAACKQEKAGGKAGLAEQYRDTWKVKQAAALGIQYAIDIIKEEEGQQ
jgi:hypothetical protein